MKKDTLLQIENEVLSEGQEWIRRRLEQRLQEIGRASCRERVYSSV